MRPTGTLPRFRPTLQPHKPWLARILVSWLVAILPFSSAATAGPYVTETSGIRWNDVAGVRWNDAAGIRWNDAAGIRWNDTGGVRWNDAAGRFFTEASGLRWNDAAGIRWNDAAGEQFDDAMTTGGTSLDLVVLDTLSTLPDSSSIGVIVVYRSYPGAADFANLTTIGLSGGTVFRRLPMVVVNATKQQIDAIRQLPRVRSVYAERTLSFFDEDSRRLIGINDVETDPDLRTPAGAGPTGDGVTIAVLDSGVDATHPDLPFGPKVVQNVRLNTAAGLPTGFVYPLPVEGIPNTDLVLGHGTFVASVAAGTGSASAGRYRGVAPGASILAISAGDLLITNVLEGFDYILDNTSRFSVKVVNCSWGTEGWFDPDDPVNIATRALYDAGITVVFAAGNHGPAPDTLNAYSVAPWVIGVGSVRRDGGLSDFSSRGIFEESVYHPILVAPGEGVIAASPVALAGVNGVYGVADPAAGVTVPPGDAVYYTASSGTSFAAPHVAGVVAMMLEENPSLTPSDIKRILQQTATPILGHDRSEAGAGRLDAWAALTQVQDPARPFGTHVAGWLDQRPWSVVHATPVYTNGIAHPGAETLLDAHLPGAPLSWQMTLAWGTSPPASDLDVEVLNSAGTQVARSEAFNGAYLFGRAEGVHLLVPTDSNLRVGVRFKGDAGLGDQTFQMREETAVAVLIGYTDLDALGAPDRDLVTRAVSRRLMVGRGSRFEAASALTRAELARALALGAGRPQRVPSSPSFWDVNEYAASFPYIETVAGARDGTTILAPITSRVFRPQAAVTRLDFAVALVRAAGLEDEAKRRAGERIAVTDFYRVNSGKRGYVAVALERHLIDAIPSGGHLIFSPAGSVTRLDSCRYLLTLLDALNGGGIPPAHGESLIDLRRAMVGATGGPLPPLACPGNLIPGPAGIASTDVP